MWQNILKGLLFVVPFAKKSLKRILKKKLEEKQDEIVKYVNSKIDLPKLTERQEEKLFTQIYDALQGVLEEKLLD